MNQREKDALLASAGTAAAFLGIFVFGLSSLGITTISPILPTSVIGMILGVCLMAVGLSFILAVARKP